MIGKFCILSTFLTIYVFTAELFPTVIRYVTIEYNAYPFRAINEI